MAASTREKLIDLLKDFHSGMLVTRTAEGELRARPMAVAQVEESGDLWFATGRESGKVDEVEGDWHVNVTMQGSRQFASISGVATLHEDRQKIEELWEEDWRVWFPGGKDDPNLVLLKVNANAGEYWDTSGPRGLKFLLEAGKAYFSSERPRDDDRSMHGKVKL